MSSFPSLSTLPPGLHAPAAGWSGARPAPDAGRSQADAAEVFGFNGSADVARALTVPPARGDGVAQLEARFLACLFQRG
jgi:hypothetical protein